MTRNIIDSKQKLKEYLDCELKYYPKKHLGFIVTENNILRKHIKLLRKTEYYTNTNKKLRAIFYKVKLQKLQNKYLMHIPLNTCGKGLHIVHVGSASINTKAIIGENCVLHVNTYIMANNGAPHIGNNVFIGYDSAIMGGIEIADDTVIGVKSLVNKSITEPGTVVVGIPAKKIRYRKK